MCLVRQYKSVILIVSSFLVYAKMSFCFDSKSLAFQSFIILRSSLCVVILPDDVCMKMPFCVHTAFVLAYRSVVISSVWPFSRSIVVLRLLVFDLFLKFEIILFRFHFSNLPLVR